MNQKILSRITFGDFEKTQLCGVCGKKDCVKQDIFEVAVKYGCSFPVGKLIRIVLITIKRKVHLFLWKKLYFLTKV